MRSRRVGTTALEVSELGLGAAPLGNLYRATSEESAREAVDDAWTAGIRYFDTAPHYGLGLSERRLGTALRDRPRSQYVLSTKVGRLLEADPDGSGAMDPAGFVVPATHRRVWDFSRDGVLRSLEASLQRLGLDRIDVAYVHDPDEHWASAVEQGFPALADLRAQGVLGAIGAGMNQSAMLTRFVRETDLDVVLVAGRYTLLEQEALDDLLPAAEAKGTSVVAAAVFNSGVLARNRPAPDATYDYRSAPPDVLRRARRIGEVCEAHGTTLPAAALAFPLGHPRVISVVVGCADGAEVRRNASLHEQGVPSAVWEELRSEGLLRADAPTPALRDAAMRA